MKKIYPYADLMVALCGAAAAALRAWHLRAGTDARGLYPTDHPGWIGFLALTSAAVFAIWYLTRRVSDHDRYEQNFSAGILPAMGCWAAAAAIFYYSIINLSASALIVKIAAWMGFITTGALLSCGLCRKVGKKPHALTHLMPALFFALVMLQLARLTSDETEFVRFISPFLALLSTMLAAFQQWGFDVQLGSRKKSLFWSLTALFFCAAAIADTNSRMLFIALSVWHLLSHCRLQPEETPDQPDLAN